jgi:very-short-patch-repair endonuclease
MRSVPTDAERALWQMLRGRRLCGARFRRQQPIGPYIVDFYCSAAKLVIELDGSQHGADASTVYDESRTRYLESVGFQVLRIWNSEFFEDREAVGRTIECMLRERIPRLLR